MLVLLYQSLSGKSYFDQTKIYVISRCIRKVKIAQDKRILFSSLKLTCILFIVNKTTVNFLYFSIETNTLLQGTTYFIYYLRITRCTLLKSVAPVTTCFFQSDCVMYRKFINNINYKNVHIKE